MNQAWKSYPGSIRLLAIAAVIFSAGMLFDRWGKMQTIVLSSLGIIVISLCLGFATDFTVYTVLLMFNGLFYGTLFLVMNALAVVMCPEGGRRGINMIYVALNAGVVVGSALGGVLASVSFAWTFFGNAIAQIAVLAMFALILPRHLKAIALKQAEKNEGQKEAAPPSTAAADVLAAPSSPKTVWGALLLLCAGLLISWIVYAQWTTVLSTYMQSLDISLRQYSLLWTLNGALILFGQPLVSWIIKHFAKTLRAQMLLGAFIFQTFQAQGLLYIMAGLSLLSGAFIVLHGSFRKCPPRHAVATTIEK